jgi:hypothetical protein
VLLQFKDSFSALGNPPNEYVKVLRASVHSLENRCAPVNICVPACGRLSYGAQAAAARTVLIVLILMELLLYV